MADKLYYAKGLEVWKSPVRTKIHGGESISVGFHACTASEVIGEEGAIAIAALLCLGEQAQTPSPQPREVGSGDLRKRVMRAIFDPGETVGAKGDRDLTTWQTDAVMNVLSKTEQAP